jgi:hypothetical protein
MNREEVPLVARHGMQISLDPERYQAVTDLAENQERPLTEVVREVFDLGLAQVKRRKQRKIQASRSSTPSAASSNRESGSTPAIPSPRFAPSVSDR